MVPYRVSSVQSSLDGHICVCAVSTIIWLCSDDLEDPECEFLFLKEAFAYLPMEVEFYFCEGWCVGRIMGWAKVALRIVNIASF